MQCAAGETEGFTVPKIKLVTSVVDREKRCWGQVREATGSTAGFLGGVLRKKMRMPVNYLYEAMSTRSSAVSTWSTAGVPLKSLEMGH
jgi:hypothetical protein